MIRILPVQTDSIGVRDACSKIGTYVVYAVMVSFASKMLIEGCYKSTCSLFARILGRSATLTVD